MKNLCIALMSAVLFGCGMSNESKDGIVGTWEVNANGIIYQITLSPDSTLTETLFGTLGRWQWKAGDSTTSEPAHLTLLNEGGTERWFFVNKVSETSLDLVAADNPISLKRTNTDDSKPLPPFDQFRLLFIDNGNDWMLVPLAREKIIELVTSFVPERGMFQSGQALINSDSLFVAALFDYMSSGVAVFNTQTQERLDYQDLFHGEGCTSSYQLSTQNGRTIIEQTAGCDEEVTKKSFVIDKSGKITALAEGAGLTGDKATDELLRRLMGAVFYPDSRTETTQGTSLIFTGKDNPDYSVAGSTRQLGDLLIVEVHETADMGGSSKSGVFKKEGDAWTSQFSSELIPGVPDNILDLNGDGKLELIMHERDWSSAGAHNTYSFFAKTTSDRFEKISSIATSVEGFSPMLFDENNKMIVSTIKYVPSNGATAIQVTENRTWVIDAAQNKSGEENEVITYVWDGSRLTKNQK